MRITRIKIGCWRSHPVPARSCRFRRQRSLATRSPKSLATCWTLLGSQWGRSRLLRLLKEPNASRDEIVYSAHQLHVAPHRAGLPFARFKHDPNSPTHVCFDGRAEQLRWRQHLVEIVQGRTNALQERSDPATIASAVELLGDSGTAPQPSCPKTTNSGVCRCVPAYCSVPVIKGPRTFPATP